MKRLWNTRTGNRWLFGGFLLASAGLGGLAAWLNPPLVGVLPPCVFRRATGWRCPACGGTRMLAALLRGDLAAAWYYHPLLLLLLAGGVLLLLWGVVRTFFRGWKPPELHVRSLWWLLVPGMAVAFLLLRNTGWYQTIFY